MAKKVKIMEACVITSDEKGQRTLVGKAKEALTTFSKNKIDVTIVLENTSKEDAEKYLKENNVPYKELMTQDELHEKKPKFDACIIPDNNVVVLRDDWTWCLSNLVDKLYDNSNKPPQKSEQEKMDDKFNDYKRWADQANAARKKQNVSGDSVAG
jgi:hypothetical protein